MRTLALAIVLAVSVPAVVIASPDQAKLSQTRVDTASRLYDATLAKWKAGTATLDQVVAWSQRWLTALREQPVKGARLKAALADHLARMKDLETAVGDAVGKGIAPASDRDVAAYFVAEAELWAARGK